MERESICILEHDNPLDTVVGFPFLCHTIRVQQRVNITMTCDMNQCETRARRLQQKMSGVYVPCGLVSILQASFSSRTILASLFARAGTPSPWVTRVICRAFNPKHLLSFNNCAVLSLVSFETMIHRGSLFFVPDLLSTALMYSQ